MNDKAIRCPESKMGRPARGCRMLPIVTYERKKWFFDERLRQLRSVENPLDWMDLNEFEMEYFRGKIRRRRYMDETMRA